MIVDTEYSKHCRTSGQDGGIDRHAPPPCPTIKKITTNLKQKNTQNCQKIKLHGSLITKDLKKPYSTRAEEVQKWGVGPERTQCGSGGEAVVAMANRMGGLTFMCDE